MARTYYSQILAWDWKGLLEDAEKDEDAEGNGIYSVLLGSVFSLTPSGKYYMPWTTNQTAEDERKDAAWFAALERAAEKHGATIASGDGDPCDLFAIWYIPEDLDPDYFDGRVEYA